MSSSGASVISYSNRGINLSDQTLSMESQNSELPSSKKTRVRDFVAKYLGTFVFVAAVSGLIFNFFGMGTVFWLVLIGWLLVVRLILKSRKPSISDFEDSSTTDAVN